jgi:hypothetical protein
MVPPCSIPAERELSEERSLGVGWGEGQPPPRPPHPHKKFLNTPPRLSSFFYIYMVKLAKTLTVRFPFFIIISNVFFFFSCLRPRPSMHTQNKDIEKAAESNIFKI